MAQRKAAAAQRPPKAMVAQGGDKRLEPAPRDRRRERGEASIQRIIDATIDLIADEGLASVTMQRIAEHVGSSNALVVFHFRSKENLFRAVLQYLSDQYDELWATLVRVPGLSPVERLMGAVECAQRFARQHPKWVSVFVVFSSDRKSMQIYNEIGLPSDLSCNKRRGADRNQSAAAAPMSTRIHWLKASTISSMAHGSGITSTHRRVIPMC